MTEDEKKKSTRAGLSTSHLWRQAMERWDDILVESLGSWHGLDPIVDPLPPIMTRVYEIASPDDAVSIRVHGGSLLGWQTYSGIFPEYHPFFPDAHHPRDFAMCDALTSVTDDWGGAGFFRLDEVIPEIKRGEGE